MNSQEIQFAQIETAKTLSWMTAHTQFHQLKETIQNILESNEHIPYCEHHQDKMYHLLQNEEYPKGLYRMCLASDYRRGCPQWKALLNVADLDRHLQDDVYLESYQHCTQAPHLLLLHLSSQGQDAHYTVEFDLRTQTLTPKGFHLPLSHSIVTWKDKDSVWLCPASIDTTTSRTSHPKEVYLLERGQTLEDAKLIFQVENEHFWVEAWRYLDPHGSPLDIVKQYHSFYHFTYYVVKPNLGLFSLKLPPDCELCGYLNGLLIILLKSNWKKSKTQQYTLGSVLAVQLNKGLIRVHTLLFVPKATQVVESIETSKDFIFIHYLESIYSQACVWKMQGQNLMPISFPKLKAINFELIDQPWGTNLFYIVANDLITEPILYLWDAKRQELSILRRQKPMFDTTASQLKQFWATSTDSTQVPYFWCGSSSNPVPTLVYCYGGFGVNELPHYMPILGKVWLEAGYSFVIANLRGGAELGEYWHQSAIRHNKYRSIEDLVAIITDLQERQKTLPSMTAIQGASNGGLIVANALISAPEQLRAVVCEVPLIDMLHYPNYASGQLWQEEYGDPQNPCDFPSLQQITVLHQIKGDVSYPKLLLTSSLKDDRVDPTHAALFHKAMLSFGHCSHLICEETGGHEVIAQEHYIQSLTCIWFFLYNALQLVFKPHES
ncbi:MAG: prolyl oligopeptidase family serine peptidase [Neisseriaceae bacterium]